MFVFGFAVALHQALAGLLKQDELPEERPYGWALKLDDDFDSTDDDLRRSLVLDYIEFEGLWKFFLSGDPGSDKLLTAICKEEGLYLSEILSQAQRENQCSRKYPSMDSTSDSYKEFLGFLRSKALASLWKKRGIAIDDLKDDELASIGRTLDIFLTKEKFHSLSYKWTMDDFDLCRKVCGEPFVKTEEKVHRRIKIGSDNYTQNLSKGLSSVIRNIVLPELKHDGKLKEMAFYERIDALATDNSCGVNVSREIDLISIHEKYIERYDEYVNLLMTVALCSGRVSYEKTWTMRGTSTSCLGHDSDEEYSVLKESWIPAEYGKKTPSSVLTQVKPLINGLTQFALSSGRLDAIVKRYLCQKAVMIAPTFTTLSQNVQSFLISRFKDASKVPLSVIARVTGKTDEEAAEAIFSMKDSIPKNQKSQNKSEVSPSAPNVTQQPNLFQSGTPAQKKRLTEAFGGDFKHFLKMKRRLGLKGKLDLMKLSNYFDKGKFKPGKKSTAEICKVCSLN